VLLASRILRASVRHTDARRGDNIDSQRMVIPRIKSISSASRVSGENANLPNELSWRGDGTQLQENAASMLA